MFVIRREPSTRRDLDQQVERARDLLSDRTEGQVDACCQHQRLEAGQRVTGRVRVDRRQRALVARVHRLEHVQGLGAADLADDDPVGTHAQRVPDELADADLALALDVRRRASSVITCSCWSWSSAASSIVTIRSSPGMKAETAFSVVVLPVPVPPEMRTLSFPRTHAARNWADFAVSVSNAIRSSIVYGSRENFRIVSVGPLSESGGMIAFTRLPSGRRVDHRGGLVHSAPDLGDDLVDDPEEVGVVGERRVGPLDLACPLDEDPVEVVDHHLGHVVVPEQGSSGP